MQTHAISATCATSPLTVYRLRELLNYDAKTGIFTWLVRTNSRVAAGSAAGGPSGHGYWKIGVDGVRYQAHRLAWFYVHGVWPAGDIDHINGDRANNMMSNLREVSRSVNLQNQRRARSDNKSSGLLGVTESRGRWMAQINIDNKNRYLGRFDTPETAHAAYLAAKRQNHEGCTI